jgi:hypothetical protein
MVKKIGLLIATLLIAVFLCSQAVAVTDFRIAGIEARSAYVSVEGPVHEAFTWGGSVNLGNINTNTYLRVDLLYWQKSYFRPPYPDYPFNYKYNYKDLATKINILYTIPHNQIIPYIGGGFTIHKYTWNYSHNGYHHPHSYTRTELGFQVFGGAQYKLPHNFYCFAEAAFDRSDRDQIFAGGGLGYNIKWFR